MTSEHITHGYTLSSKIFIPLIFFLHVISYFLVTLIFLMLIILFLATPGCLSWPPTCRGGVFTLSESGFLPQRIFRQLGGVHTFVVCASYFLPGQMWHLSSWEVSFPQAENLYKRQVGQLHTALEEEGRFKPSQLPGGGTGGCPYWLIDILYPTHLLSDS